MSRGRRVDMSAAFALVEAGLTHGEIGAALGASYPTIYRWAKTNGITITATKRGNKFLKFFGCTRSEAIALNDSQLLSVPKCKALRYVEHRKGAALRGIAWEFTFAQWLAVWDESGRWPERGHRLGMYCMGRHGDVGPYSQTNVAIIPVSENHAVAWQLRRAAGVAA